MSESLNDLISEVHNLPSKLHDIVENLSDDQLNLKIENWSVKDIIHHLADTHTVIYIRIKQILTNEPISVKPVNNKAWSGLVDYNSSVSNSLNMISGIHHKIGIILENLTSEELKETFNHPERGRISMESYIKTLVNHGNSHMTKIKSFTKSIR
jgi:hypothetical protein